MNDRTEISHWIKHALPVSGDGDYVQAAFYVRLHDGLTVDEQEELIRANIEDCTLSKHSSTVETESNNDDPAMICPGVKVFYFLTKWRRQLDGCESRIELQQEYDQKQQEIISLLSGKKG